MDDDEMYRFIVNDMTDDELINYFNSLEESLDYKINLDKKERNK